jgi:hypothetical protein
MTIKQRILLIISTVLFVFLAALFSFDEIHQSVYAAPVTLYVEPGGTNCNPGACVGGYNNDLTVWNPEVYASIVDAQRRGRVVNITDGYSPTLEGLILTSGNGTGNVNLTRWEESEMASLRFAAFGDFGVGYGSSGAQAVADLVNSWEPNLIITTGDNNYYDLSSTLAWDETVGHYYGQYIRYPDGSPSAYAPGNTTNQFFPSLGNHDIASGGYEAYFELPGTDIESSHTSGNERYYDFVVGPVHFFAINSDPREPDGITSTSTQALWLKTQVAASTAPWKIVYMHYPPYDSGEKYLPDEYTVLRWPFEHWGVTAVVAGHEHN